MKIKLAILAVIVALSASSTAYSVTRTPAQRDAAWSTAPASANQNCMNTTRCPTGQRGCWISTPVAGCQCRTSC